jgi:hypothetical protein
MSTEVLASSAKIKAAQSAATTAANKRFFITNLVV